MDNEYVIKLDRALVFLRLSQKTHCMTPVQKDQLGIEIQKLLNEFDSGQSAPFDLVAAFEEFTGQKVIFDSWRYRELLRSE